MRTTFCLSTYAIVLLVVLTACSPAATLPTPTEPPAPTAVPPTATIVPTTTSILPQQPIKGKFDVGGYSLYLECSGSGGPTTVLEAGAQADSTNFVKLWDKLEPHTRVCAYDRAGSGKSDLPLEGARSSAQWVEDLRRLLSAAKEDGPYVLVGHSLGGINVLVYADKYPQEVAGAVLIDSYHPDIDEHMLALLPTESPIEPLDLAGKRIELSEPVSLAGWDFEASAAQVRAIKSLGDLPLIVITTDPAKASNNELDLKLEQGWLELQKEYAALSSQGELIVAPTGWHDIHRQEPQLVADAILNVVKAARQK